MHNIAIEERMTSVQTKSTGLDISTNKNKAAIRRVLKVNNRNAVRSFANTC